ncbi:MAG: hypothetical protein EXQ91_01840 [Alphaproteobacteria bacterium]|nr:hypothetical protein [Alphaproteobacteria bacterium]
MAAAHLVNSAVVAALFYSRVSPGWVTWVWLAAVWLFGSRSLITWRRRRKVIDLVKPDFMKRITRSTWVAGALWGHGGHTIL